MSDMKEPKEIKINTLMEHYAQGRDEMERRKTRKNGWDEVLQSYFGVLPTNWPYHARLVDPVLRTVILEKNARLLNGKLRGTLIPREGGDIIKAKIQNAVLDYQWDKANKDGSMMDKISLSDIQARLFGASFGLVYWDKETECNEFKVLDNRNVFVDFQSSDVKGAKWVQVREWVRLEDLEEQNEHLPEEMQFKNLDKVKNSRDRRDNKFTSVIKQSHGVEDQIGRDNAHPTIEMVTEYSEDKWVSFFPNRSIITRVIDNPREDEKIPVVMLRYYFVGDDVYGDSEIEPVLPLQRAINAVLSAFLDHVNITLRPPVKVAGNATVRLDTFTYGPNAIWLTGDSVNNVQTHETGSGQVISSFQSSYSVLKAALNTAMGETSMGISNINPFEGEKTATEVRNSEKQRLTRDQRNQISLEQFLTDIMMLWLGNNKQFLFADKTQSYRVQRIVGKDMLKELQGLGLDSYEIPEESMTAMRDSILETGGQMSDAEIEMIANETRVPKYPVITNPNEKKPENYDIKPKLEMDESGAYGSVYMTEDDLEGVYDYVPSIKSMAANESEREIMGRNQALTLSLTPAVTQGLAQVNKRVNIAELLTEVFEDSGVKNAERIIEDIPQQPMMGAQGTQGTQAMPQMGAGQPMSESGMGMEAM